MSPFTSAGGTIEVDLKYISFREFVDRDVRLVSSVVSMSSILLGFVMSEIIFK